MPLPAYTHWQHIALDIFSQKYHQYGESWSELSLPSLVDILYIKASRIRTLMQSNAPAATGESSLNDWLALANYAALTIARLRHLSPDHLSQIYAEAEALLERKNADYGNAWQHMRPLAFIEFILMKLARIRQMDASPATYADSISDNLFDIINYAFLYLSRYGDTTATT
ncbi:MAG: DUF1599 domain-containing protein [Bacteroidia bacterium]|nr:DUF1599 domain-containing protein [Bacteroidia bacterium]MCX7652136.1 DUF1599 domain-containing protein [Bacteroidia bacterium]MDW8416915.1 DUF1599 domain-containing protein [Bacteroidia bacterium]